MAGDAQRDTERGVKQTGFVSHASHEFLPQLSEGNLVVMSVEIDRFALAASCAAILASVIIALVYSVSPSEVRLGLSQYLVLLGYAALPVCGMLSGSLRRSGYLSNEKLIGLRVMAADELGDSEALAMHVSLDDNLGSASTLAKVLALIRSNPLVHAVIVCAAVVSGIGLANRPTHLPYGIKFNTDLQAKWGELLETRLASAKGNQQPSAMNGETLIAKVQRLAGEEPTNKPATAPHAKAMI